MNKETTMKKTSFSAMIYVPTTKREIPIDVEFDKDEYSLTYDEVENAIYDKLNDEYGIDDCSMNMPDADVPQILDIVINADDGNQYPVISESMDDTELKKSKTFDKFLVLPDATYTLTQECKLWMSLKEDGIINANEEFDFDKYHALVEKIDECK